MAFIRRITASIFQLQQKIPAPAGVFRIIIRRYTGVYTKEQPPEEGTKGALQNEILQRSLLKSRFWGKDDAPYFALPRETAAFSSFYKPEVWPTYLLLNAGKDVFYSLFYFATRPF